MQGVTLIPIDTRTATMPTGKTLLVTGASGQLGRRVVELLLEAGETHLVALTRTPEKLAHFAERGVTVRYGSFDEPESLPAAFAGVDRLLLISTDAVGQPGKRVQQHTVAIQAAAAAQVKHVVYTSLLNPINSPITLAPDHAQTEAALEASTLGFTVLRNNMYADGLPGTLEQALSLGGNLYNAIGDGKISYIPREDCAQIAAAALASSFEGRRTLDVTGGEALSQVELAAIGAAVSGKPITYVPLPADVFTANLLQVGLPQVIADLVVSFDVAAAQNQLSAVSSAVQDLTGHAPIRIADFIASQAAILRG